MTTSLGKLQKTVIEQEQKIIELQDKLAKVTGDRNSLKHRLDKLEKEFEERLEEKVNKAVNKAVEEVTKHYEEIIAVKDKRIFELECRLNINSETSSLPSSKDPIDKEKRKKEIQNSREKTTRPIGGQVGHEKHSLKRFKDEEITKRIKHKQDKCPHCHSNNLITTGIKERDELEVKIVLDKIRHTFETQRCKDCGKIIKNKITENLHSDNQYGSNLKSIMLILYNYGFVSYERIKNIIYGLTNGEVHPSEGYMVKLQKKTGEKLNNFVFDVAEVLKKSKLLHWDDTVVGIEKKDKACFRAYSDRKFVLYKAHMAKNTEGMDEDGILQNLAKDTVVVHDHLLHNYCKDYQYQNAECNAHITRKLKGIAVNTNHKWADNMEKFLKSTLNLRKEKIENKILSFTETELAELLSKYDEIVNQGFIEYKELKHKYEYTNEENLLEFLRDYKESITLWIKDFTIPYSNNFVESLLRMIKTKMKISLNFKSLKHAEYFANIKSYTETCGHFGINRACALKKLFDGEPYTVQELSAI